MNLSLSPLPLVVGLCLAGAIFYLVRRNHLHGPYAAGWLALAAVIIVVSIWPRSIDWASQLVGIYYPPILVCMLAIAALLLKSLIGDLERSQQERSLRRLSQKLAILENELERLKRGEPVPPARHDDPD